MRHVLAVANETVAGRSLIEALERLSTEDILDISYLFLLAGLDTVTASLGCAVAYLAQHPERQQALREDLGLVPAAVEELLRWETPADVRARKVRERQARLPGDHQQGEVDIG